MAGAEFDPDLARDLQGMAWEDLAFSYTLEFGLSGGARVDRFVLLWGDAALETMVIMQRPEGMILATPYGGTPPGMLVPSHLIGAVTQVDMPGSLGAWDHATQVETGNRIPILLLEARAALAAHLFPLPEDLNDVPSLIPSGRKTL